MKELIEKSNLVLCLEFEILAVSVVVLRMLLSKNVGSFIIDPETSVVVLRILWVDY